MRLLLDTHIALWAITDSPALPTEARRLILAPHNEIFVSAASIWEISIKHGLGRGDIPVSGGETADYFCGYTSRFRRPWRASVVGRGVKETALIW
jgi:PIN domain nuclease of toxin-antitoxin system